MIARLRSPNGTIIDEPSFANNGSSLFQDRNPRHGNPYFNPNHFTLEPLGQFGNVPPEFFSGPGIDNYDVALLKDTRIKESTSRQFRAEAFNVFNHAQFGLPNGNVTIPVREASGMSRRPIALVSCKWPSSFVLGRGLHAFPNSCFECSET